MGVNVGDIVESASIHGDGINVAAVIAHPCVGVTHSEALSAAGRSDSPSGCHLGITWWYLGV
jgi:hypothetical protein